MFNCMGATLGTDGATSVSGTPFHWQQQGCEEAGPWELRAGPDVWAGGLSAQTCVLTRLIPALTHHMSVWPWP